MDKFILLLMFVSLFLSCGKKLKSQKDTDTEHQTIQPTDTIVAQQADTVLTNDEVIRYFEVFREFLLNEEVEKLANLVHFPVEGDYSWKRMDEDGKVILDFNSYRTKEDFIENYSKLFDRDLANLLEKVDLEKVLEKDYSVIIEKEPNIELSFTVDFINWFESHVEQNPTMVSFEVDHNEKDCDTCENGIIYRFKKVDGIIKLTSIQFVG